MCSMKIVYTDDNKDKAVVGNIEDKDGLFITIIDQYGSRLKIAKRRIVLIKELYEHTKTEYGSKAWMEDH